MAWIVERRAGDIEYEALDGRADEKRGLFEQPVESIFREVVYRMLLQVISVVGALMVLTAYGLNQGGVWRELHAGYLALNIAGSLLLGIVAIVDQRAGFILLEFAWAGLGFVGVARAVRARQHHQ